MRKVLIGAAIGAGVSLGLCAGVLLLFHWVAEAFSPAAGAVAVVVALAALFGALEAA